MKALPRKSDTTEEPTDEVESFGCSLDKNYARMRESARAAWERLHGGKDPSDVCVSVRVALTAVGSIPYDGPADESGDANKPTG